ncbi:MAG TPA: cobyric acid synthase [Candidatus Binataceae bacterium]|nr:cobyric acid synthase [Candidatus Binataceae bacterium]
MVQGTASSVGKSLIVTALCRIFHREGFNVAPFKAQNMALNSYVTPDGGEIGRAQAVQAEAAGIEPRVEMNPILLKPEGGMRSQVVVLGKPRERMTWSAYQRLKPEFVRIIADSLRTLREHHDLIVIEGAGSPAEVNLSSQDIVNMHVAAEAEAPVLLVGDIDRGGVFAHLVGTMELLAPADRARVAGFLINKFRGDPALLTPGLEFLRARFGVPVLGVIPYVERLRIADEDSVALEDRRNRRTTGSGQIDIAVIRLPRISNYDDFLALEHEDGVTVRFVEEAGELTGADLAIIPGTKSTVADLGWLNESGFARAIVARAGDGGLVAGICGGYQMLGERIEDPHRVESDEASARGLGLLPIVTRFAKTKVTTQVRARVEAPSILGAADGVADEISAYEIHMGNVERAAGTAAPFRIVARNGAPADKLDGAINREGTVAGTMLHGIFENDVLRVALLRALRRRKGIAANGGTRPLSSRETEYDRLAEAVAASVDLPKLKTIAKLD